MNPSILAKQLTKIYNTLGNDWLVQNYETEPFDFRVYVRRGQGDDLHDYEVEIYSDRLIPKDFKYRNKKNGIDGSHISFVQNFFKNLATYVDGSFGDFQKTLGVKFMDMDYKNNS